VRLGRAFAFCIFHLVANQSTTAPGKKTTGRSADRLDAKTLVGNVDGGSHDVVAVAASPVIHLLCDT